MSNKEYLNNNFLQSYGTNWLFDILTPSTGSLVYKQISEDLIEIVNKEKIVPGWSSGNFLLDQLFTSSLQEEPNYKDYSLTIYSDSGCNNQNEEFKIEYGHSLGYGIQTGYRTEKTSTLGIYRKYINATNDSDLYDYVHFFAISFKSIASADSIYSDYFSLRLANPDDSEQFISMVNYQYFQNPTTYNELNNFAVDIVSGSLESGIYNTTTPEYLGKLYPSLGVLILNADKLNDLLNLNINSDQNISANSTERLFNSISASIDNYKNAMYKYWCYFHVKKMSPVLTMPIRLEAGEFNYSTNPSFYNESGSIKTIQFLNNPSTFFTTIGLYSKKYELLAVAKLSSPLIKNFTEKYIFQVNIELK